MTTEDKILVRHIDGSNNGKDVADNIRIDASKLNQDPKTTITGSVTTKTKNLFQNTLDVVNNIRNDLMTLGETREPCSKHLSPATIQSPVECNLENTPPFTRQDHQCEQLYWTYEELGVDNEGEMIDARCPFKTSYRGVLSTDRFLSEENREDKENSEEGKITKNEDEEPKGRAFLY